MNKEQLLALLDTLRFKELNDDGSEPYERGWNAALDRVKSEVQK